MQNQDIKYHLLENRDREENHHENGDAIGESANQFKIHWSFKILFFLFLCAQFIYVMYSFNSEYNYFDGNITVTGDRMCNASDLKDECQDYDILRTIAIDQLTTERKSNEIYWTKNTTQHEIKDFSEVTTDERNSSDHEIIAFEQLTTLNAEHALSENESIVNNPISESADDHVDLMTATSMSPTEGITYSTSTHHEKGMTGDESDDNDDVFMSTGGSSSTQKLIGGIEKIATIEKSHDHHIQDLTTATTTTSITPNSNYSNGKSVAPNVPSAFEQWSITTEVLLPITTTTLNTPTITTTTTRKTSNTPTKTTTTTRTTPKPLVIPYLNDSQQQTQTKAKEAPPPSPPPEQRKYFINTSRCHMPFIDPFTSEARKRFKPSHTTGCANNREQAIVSAFFDELSEEYILRINFSVAMDLMKSSNAETVVEDLLCCYRQIERSGSGGNVDKQFKLLPCTNFHQDFVVPSHINGVIVDCTSKKSKKLLQQDAFSFIQPINKTPQEKRRRIVAETEDHSRDHRKLGVLLIGIDSLSRMNFRRNMPQTFKYLVDKGWYELKGYNKVGDNTLPNLMPLLAGYTRTTTYSKCKPTSAGGMDNCNFIWTKFREHGFVTAYAEDTTTISTFNYRMKGFKQPPTDYYFRPIALAIEKTMQKKQKAGLYYCVGRQQYGEYIYDYGLEFATRYQNQSNFGLFWTNSFSHNAYDTPATMDARMQQYLQDLEWRGILETSVVIFFSDHGRRWGPLLKLPEGFLEERLPMFYMSVPQWFKNEYPYFARNLEVNQGRLATPFDVYMTMQHLLHITVPAYNVTPAYDCPAAQSLLHEMPENRTCADACIPEAWCTCIPYLLQSPTSGVVKHIAQLILNEMNGYFVTKNISSLCSKLTLHEITRAKLREKDVDVDVLQSSTQSSDAVDTYVIEFTTNPKTKPATEFSATVDYDAKRQRIVMNVEDISRQSKYEGTAKCIDDKQAKKYCICRNSLKSS